MPNDDETKRHELDIATKVMALSEKYAHELIRVGELPLEQVPDAARALALRTLGLKG